MQYVIAWLKSDSPCWAVSVNEGVTFSRLKSDNYEDSSEAVQEASDKFNVATDKWEVLDDPINDLIDSK